MHAPLNHAIPLVAEPSLNGLSVTGPPDHTVSGSPLSGTLPSGALLAAAQPTASPDVSIVVCTRNRAALLRGALASLYDLATEGEFSYEIVVVDNGSSDETPQVIAAAMQECKHPLRGVRESQTGIVAARNRGLAAARGRWIAFFDDDQLADWHWLAELFRGTVEKNCRVVGGSVQLALPAECKRELDPAVQRLLGESVASDEPLRYGGRHAPGGGNLMVERNVFDQVGRFETAIDGRGEDADLFFRIERAGIEAWYFPTAVVHHLTPAERLEQEYLLRVARIVGQGDAMRQRARLGFVRFAALWLARWVHQWVVKYPRWMWSRLGRNSELTLGRRCELATAQGFIDEVDPATLSQPTLSQPALSQPAQAPAPHPAAPQGSPVRQTPSARPAPVYILRSGEPTAVMDIPAAVLGAPAVKFPSH